ncbi:hypothetical protein ASPZODRAFT_15006 [Penicilliopsis zonata CBS 506.65]|uniref:FAD-binding PCMH-type domain-containing protein n=1 Tax=Penicilliopsis zonata CBS 506.65 TaxID=1073090 RepID=A0A1L9SK59_9EURO|nr:hypothetical protein ASPZODRAFT_15006 [Penicilliopsis zonata CBS 506.65]OJJ47555.1 hypothetical protein ASPZODRAFT_15006 [Penicilliopsis zonata CBS 506.65]
MYEGHTWHPWTSTFVGSEKVPDTFKEPALDAAIFWFRPLLFADTPGDECWPSTASWNTLNTTVNGKLLHNRPLAEPCYPGDNYDADACQYISDQWTNATIVSENAVGYSYPLVTTCPPINTTVAAYPICDLGTAPVYTINATEAADVAAGIKFAKENNIRLVIKNTGHDGRGRSQGYGSLMIWIKYIDSGLAYQPRYNSSCASNWTGAAFTVGGGYIWGDVYDAAAEHGMVAVGGDDRTVGVIGGYMQGGGHGPASHDFGLAADQVLDMTVVLATGETVTANACQYADLFTALRGGGGGTYGVVISATIKLHPSAPMIGQVLSVVPLNASVAALLNVSAQITARYPTVMDAGFSGYGYLGTSSLLDPSLTAEGLYTHTIAKRLPDTNTSASWEAAKEELEDKLVADLIAYNSTDLYVSVEYYNFSSFVDYYDAIGGGESSVGTSDILITSRLFDKASLEDNAENLAEMMHTIFSTEGDNSTLTLEGVVLNNCLVAGGQVLEETPYTSVQPSWRRAYVLANLIAFWGPGLDTLEIQRVRDDVTYRKMDAMRRLTPGMGSYLNEADSLDPQWKEDFYGTNYDWLTAVKHKYDPDGVFYCYRCIGSLGWSEDVRNSLGYGPLCQT